ncbi:MAG: hypothetical protein JO333_13865 [Verrucomicrobia bacterium]|nr:hypothetical protein [Verrucomicrobiota bacterium]
MELLTLLLARTVKNPFALKSEAEKRPQTEPALPAIDFALLAKTTRETKASTRGRKTFSGRPATAAYN